MSDLAERVAQAEDRFQAQQELQELIDNGYAASVFDGTRWTFPVSSKGEGEQ